MGNFVEVIGINEDNCINCHQCIAICPVKICSDGSGDVVKFNNDLCIGCGRCIEVCIKSHGGIVENSARFAIDDSPQFAKDLLEHEIIALVAPSAQSNFNLGKLITALKELGVKKVYDVSLGAEITVACYHDAIKNRSIKTPMISTTCPAVVKYIELNHPILIEHLAPIGSPVHNLAVYVRSLHPEAKLAFISPCLAKSREFQNSNIVNYNVIFSSLVRVFKERGIDLNMLPEGKFDNVVPAGIAANFSSPGGLKTSYLYHYPDTPASSIAQIAGPIVFDRYLESLENSIRQKGKHLPIIVDILSCAQGCNMGVGSINKAIDEMDYSVAIRSEQNLRDEEGIKQLKEFLMEVTQKHDFSYHYFKDLSARAQLKIPTETELSKIYANMHKYEPKDFRNCAACGYNSCYQMAISVFNGLNKAENCHLYQEKELRIEKQALSNVYNELNNVFETMSEGVIVLNKTGHISQFNPAAKSITGYSDDDLIGLHVIDLFSGNAPKTMELLQTGKSYFDTEILIDGNRGQIHATCSGRPIYNEDQQVIGATIILRPIADVRKLVNTFTGAHASFTYDSIIGEDKQFKKAVKLAMAAAANNSTVLLQAESGTGKELFAQAIHNGSSRKNGPFVAINCAALPRELVGSELFGYVEGAFTGARRGGRPGKFELANKGTLLLDEIGDMPLEQQGVLLRAIQEKSIMRVGGDAPIHVDVRIIAATNKDLLQLVEEGRFRADLYYRLNVVKIWIPPLRDRPGDIKLLFNHFVKEMCPKFNKIITDIDPAVIKCLENYDWPGNIRELQNVVERTLLMTENRRITVEHLPREIVNVAIGYSPNSHKYSTNPDNSNYNPLSNRYTRKMKIIEQEKQRIIWALDMHGGNVTKASFELGISRNTLYRKMKKYNINN